MRVLIPNLTPATTYYLEFKGHGPNDTSSEWSQRFTINSDAYVKLPKTPTGLAVTNVGTAFNITWTGVNQNEVNEIIQVVSYDIEVQGSSSTQYTSEPQASTATTLTHVLTFEENSTLFSGNPQGVVTIRIRAVDNLGLKSPWTTAVVGTNPVPDPPTLASPIAGPSNISLSWQAPSGANNADIIGYRVYVGTTSGFTPNSSNLVFTGNATNYTYSTTTYTPFYFKVASVDVFGQLSSFAATGAVTAINPFIIDTSAPGVPTISSAVIANNTNGIGAVAVVTWSLASPPADLAGYVVRYRIHGSSNAWVERNFSSDTTSGGVELATAYTNYDFQVRAYDYSANYSAWSAITNATSPANTAPANVTGLAASSNRDSITYTWTAVADNDIKNYEVTFSTSSTFASGNITYLSGTATNLTVGGLTPGTTYYARVRATDVGGLSSAAWSATNTKATQAYTANASDGVKPGTASTPTVTGGLGYLNITWNPVTLNATGGPQSDLVTYEVHLSTTNNFTPTTGTKATESMGTFAQLELTPAGTPLAYSTTYYVKLIARDADGSGVAGAQGSGQMSRVAAADSVLTAADVGAATPIYVQSRGMDLVTNGTALLGTNYNFSGFNLVTTDSPGGGGSFEPPAGVSAAVNEDELIPVLTDKTYTFSYYVRQAGTSTTSRHYSTVSCYDIDGLLINPQFTMYQGATLTTLAAPLNPGDTTVTLTSATGWNNAAGATNTHLRGFIFWDYVDSKGKAWPVNTYSRNSYLGMYADGAINFGTNTITLSAPWAGPAKAAGTSLSNSASGSTYKYIAASNVIVPSVWTTYSGQIGGVDTSGQNTITKFQPGTAFVRIGWLVNRVTGGSGSDVNSTMRFGNVWFSEISAANLPEVAVAQTTADGKNKIIFSVLVASGTTGYSAGDIWFQRNGTGNIIAQWEYTGSAWASRTLSDSTIASLNVGKLVSGSITSTDITLGTGGYIRSTDWVTGSAGWRLGTGGLEINSGTIKANALAITMGSGNLLTNTAAGNGTIGWTAYTSTAVSVITIDTVNKFLGYNSFKVAAGAVGNIPGMYVTLPITSLLPNQTYTASGWVQIPTTGGATRVDMLSEGATSIVGLPRTTLTTADGTWHRLVHTFTTTSNPTGTFRLYFFTAATQPVAGNYFNVTGIQLEMGDVATSYTPKVDEILPGTITGNLLSTNIAFVSTLNINTGGVIQSVGYTGISGFQITDTAINIRSGSVNANTIVAGTGIVNNLVVNTGGAIQSSNFDATHGFQLSSTGLIVRSGSVLADVIGPGSLSSAINIVAGANLIFNGGYLKSNTYTGTSQATNPSGAGFYLGNDGLRVDQGLISAAALTAGTFTGGNIIVGASGSVRSSNYIANTSGWSLSNTALEINNGTVSSAALLIQNGHNIAPILYAGFETATWTAGSNYANTGGTLTVSSSTSSRYGFNSLNTTWTTNVTNPILWLGGSSVDYNIPVEGSGQYIFSVYTWTSGAVATNVQLKVKWSDGTSSTIGSITNGVGGTPATANRISGVATAPATATSCIVYIESSTLTTGAGYKLDGLQVEVKEAGLSTPSVWKPPGVTSIDGNVIRTGTIQSNTIGRVWNATTRTYITDPAGQPTWAVSLTGAATFTDLAVKGVAIFGDPSITNPAGYNTAQIPVAASSTYVPGSQGWQLRADGQAEFRSVVIGSLNGSAVAPGTLAADAITAGTITSGISLSGQFQAVQNAASIVINTTNASATVTSPNAGTFTAADIGRSIVAPGIPVNATIIAYASGTSVTISANATATASNVGGSIYRGRKAILSGSLGVQLKDVDGTILVSLPTDPLQSAQFNGELTANRLTVVNNFKLNGTINSINAGSSLAIDAGTYIPSDGPNVTFDWASIRLSNQGNPYAPSTDPYVNTPTGFKYDPARSAYMFMSTFFGAQMLQFTSNTPDGAQGLSISLGPAMVHTSNDVPYGGFCYDASNYYFLTYNNLPGASPIWNIQGITRTGVFRAGGPVSGDRVFLDSWYGESNNGATYGFPSIALYGGRFYTAKVTTGGNLVVYKHNAGTTSTVAYTYTGYLSNASIVSMEVGQFDYGTGQTFVVMTVQNATGSSFQYVLRDTGTGFVDPGFTFFTPDGKTPIGSTWIGSSTDDATGHFRTATNDGYVYIHTKLGASAATSTVSGNYKWKYDTGTLATSTVSAAGPTSTYTFVRRARMTVNIKGAIPTAGAGTPNTVEFYIGQDAGTKWRYPSLSSGASSTIVTDFRTSDATGAGGGAMASGAPATIIGSNGLSINGLGDAVFRDLTVRHLTATGTGWQYVGYTAGAATFVSGWNNINATAFGYARYRQVGNMVQLEGLLTRFSGTNAVAFTLPAGYRPPAGYSRVFVTMGNGVPARMDVLDNGDVQFPLGVDNSGYYSINVSFYTDV